MKTISHRPVFLGLTVFCAFAAAMAGLVRTSVFSASVSADPQANNIRVISLPTNDLVFSQVDQKIYASIPGSDVNLGNTITAIDPVTGVIGTSTHIGSEPTNLAISTDGQVIYTHLAGAFAVARFDVATRTAGQKFTVGLDSTSGPMSARDIAISPDNPSIIAISRWVTNTSPPQKGVAIYDSGVQLPQTQPGHSQGSDDITFGANGQTLFGTGMYSPLTAMSVSASGVTVTGTSTGNGDIKYDSGKLITSDGQVIDANNRTLLGTFPSTSSTAFATELSVGRVYVVEPSTQQLNSIRLRVFDVNTFTEIGNAAFFGVQGTPTSLVRWGTNGLAFRTTAGQLVLMQTDLVPTPNPMPPPLPLPTPTPTPAGFATFVRTVDLRTNDLVYNNATNSIIASIPGSAGTGLGNTLTYVNPSNGRITQSVFIGSEPTQIAAADDGVTLYTALNGANAIGTFNALTGSPSMQFEPAGNFARPEDMSAAPGNPNRVGLAGDTQGAALFDGGVQRSLLTTVGSSGINSVSFSSDANVFYGYNNQSSGFELVKFTIGSNGISGTYIASNLVSGYNVGIEHHNGLLYATSGRVVDPEARRPEGTFPIQGLADTMAIDPSTNRAFFIKDAVLSAFDLTTFAKLGSISLPSNGLRATSLVRWGANGLAYRANDSRLYLLQSQLVSDAAPLPTGILFSAPAIYQMESSSPAAVTIRRTGDVSGSTNVTFSTADITATAGSDYTAVSGMITFGPGESVKGISIPFVNDNVYEGSERFSVTMGVQPGGNAEILGSTSLDVWIAEDDQRPGIFSGPELTVSEPPTAGQSSASVRVTLSNPSIETVTVNYQTANNTATAGSDYTAVSGTLTFAPMETEKFIDVPILADGLSEPDETFRVVFSGAVNSYVPFPQITVTIKNYKAKPEFDFDGDGKSDVSVYRPSEGKWHVRGSQQGDLTATWGATTDRLVPGDYDGDGKTDPAVFRDGVFWIMKSSGGFEAANWGVATDTPAPADYDGDGKTDPAVFRDGVFWILKSTGGAESVNWGVATDVPVPADYDGDGRADPAIFRDGAWWVYKSTGGYQSYFWGIGSDELVHGDYDGDGRTDPAIFRDGVFWVYKSSGGSEGINWGLGTDTPVPADYDGDGKTDPAVYRAGDWWVLKSTGGFFPATLGLPNDIPVPSR